MFSSISVAIPRGKTGYLVVLFSLILLGSVPVFFSMGHMNISIPDIAGAALGLHFSAGAAFGSCIAILLNLARPLIPGQWTDDYPSGCHRVVSDWRSAPVSRETLVLRLRALAKNGCGPRAKRENQHIVFTRLDQLHTADIGMQTVLFFGSSSTVEYMDFIFTPRGYTKKYAVTSDSTATQIGLKDQEG